MTYAGVGGPPTDEPAERRGIIVVSVVAGLITTALSLYWTQPVTADFWGRPAGVGAVLQDAFVVGIAQALVCAAALHARERIGTAAATLLAFALLPAVAVIWGFALRDQHREWDAAGRVFTAYTHRFPDTQLHDQFLYDGVYPGYTVCAQDGDHVDRYGRDRLFCLEIDSDAPAGRQVVGGFKTPADDFVEPYGCFGDSIWCEE